MSQRSLMAARTLALALLAALGVSGCVGAGLLGGPLVSAVQLIGDRTVERTVAADLTETAGVTEAVLGRMGFGIEHRERGDGVRRLRAAAEEITVHVTLERVTGKLTRLGVRVEAGRLVADRDTGAQIHDQVASALAPARVPAADPGAAEALNTVRGEIRKLRSDIEERRVERPVTAPPAATDNPLRVEPGAIVTVPMSAALPTVGGPAPSVSVAAPVTPAMAVSPAAQAEGSGTPAEVDSRVAAPLRPASALTPIQSTRGVATER